MNEEKTHWKRLVNPEYIGAYALPPGMDMTVEISSVRRETIVVTGGKKEIHTVARLKDNRPFILNATNSKSIARLYGPYIEDWEGKQITLYASETKMSGEIVECLRIRSEVKKLQSKLTAERFEKAVESIKKGSFTEKELLEKFLLTSEQKQALDKELRTDKTIQEKAMNNA